MAKQWMFKLKNFSGKLSVRAALFGVLGIISSLAGVFFAEYVPDKFADLVGGEAVDNILSMMASSMLVVVTFSLSTMVAAYSAATQHATPRATRLVKNDSESHSAISMFLGAFIYSVVSLIALSTEYYGEKGRVILLGTTVAVLSAVIWIVIRWVDELKNMGSVHETIRRVEHVTAKALEARANEPTFGCRPAVNLPKSVVPIFSKDVGFIQNIDLEFLDDLAHDEDVEFFIENDVGAFVHTLSPLIYVNCRDEKSKLTKEFQKNVAKAFAVGSNRTFEKDPLYGISVLSGVGIKAMSPSLNDPGTAIDIVGSLVRVLVNWDIRQNETKKSEPKYMNVYFPKLKIKNMFHEAFYNLTKESIRSLQTTQSIKNALQVLQASPNPEYREAADDLLEVLKSRAQEQFQLAEDMNVLRPTLSDNCNTLAQQ